ncbi:hypothetical protein D7B24_000299 [Verticillium nonalfalfae]|uniref:Uncharacterized protein n=1 Tax=Verticillium nonalfalfae TaxID=1051616 RepID=A0A3M9YJH4_9PEZI|nr:uncharacterized protein D7B24_000299 [Verticillium nonalfalfae]RNJ60102.1 hypothetical protein D7B24_000299 [Verticillium nonalfalfae]
MSQSSTGAPQANSVTVSYTHASKDCALVDNDPSNPIIINGISAVEGEQLCFARFIVRRSSNFDSFIGIQLGFLLSTDLNEQSGFGICQHVDMKQKSGAVVPTNRHVIVVKFPRGHFTYTVQPSLPEVLACFPGSTASKLCQVSVQFTDNAQATIHGYGVPFTNVSNTTVEGWINRHESFINGMTLPEFLHQTRFSFTVAAAVNDVQAMMDIDKLPPPFEYPYGTDHEWHRERYEEQSRNLKGEKAYISSRFFKDDNSHLTAMTQSVVQDVIWLDQAAEEISRTPGPVYFVPFDSSINPAYEKKFYIIVPLTQEFRDAYASAWRRLAKNLTLKVVLFRHTDDKDPAIWNCEIIVAPQRISILTDHPTALHEVVLKTRRPNSSEKGDDDYNNIAALRFDSGLTDYKRKVVGLKAFEPMAESTNPVVSGSKEEAADKMSLHRAVMRGTGFWDWMRGIDPATNITSGLAATPPKRQPLPKLRELPVVDFVDIDDVDYVNALLHEALPTDRVRFKGYLSHRPLGLGMMTAVSQLHQNLWQS